MSTPVTEAADSSASAAIWKRIHLRVEGQLQAVERNAHRLLDREVTPDETASSLEVTGALARELGRLE